jgi:hypothetical protein
MAYSIGSSTNAKSMPQLYSINDQHQSEDKLCVQQDGMSVHTIEGVLTNHGDSRFQRKASIASVCISSTLPSNSRDITVTSEVHVVWSLHPGQDSSSES